MRPAGWHDVVLTSESNEAACDHLLQHYRQGNRQEDLCFGLWTPSTGAAREKAIITAVLTPEAGPPPGPGSAGPDCEPGHPEGSGSGRLKISKHFEIQCGDGSLSWCRRQDRIDREAALDGIWVVRTSLGTGSIGPNEAVEVCKSLARVEQAFRQIKTGRLRTRPTFACSEAHVRAHVFLCMLACCVEWHMRRRLAPLLFDEDDPDAARAQRASPVEPAPSARSKAARAKDGEAVHSFHSPPADLSTIALNDVSLGDSGSFPVATTPMPGQRKAFELLGIDSTKVFPAAGR